MFVIKHKKEYVFAHKVPYSYSGDYTRYAPTELLDKAAVFLTEGGAKKALKIVHENGMGTNFEVRKVEITLV